MKPLYKIELKIVELLINTDKAKQNLNFCFDKLIKELKPYFIGFNRIYLSSILKDLEVFSEGIPNSITQRISRLTRNSRALKGTTEVIKYMENGEIDTIKEFKQEVLIV